MAFLHQFNEFFMNQNLGVPAIQMVCYLGLINILMLLRHYRLIYLVSLAASVYWVVLNRKKLLEMTGNLGDDAGLFMGGAIVLLVALLFCFLTQSGRNK